MIQVAVQAAYYREVALPIDKPAPTTKKHIAVFNNSEINNGSDADSDEEAGDGKNKNNNSARRAKRNTLKDLAKNENQNSPTRGRSTKRSARQTRKYDRWPAAGKRKEGK